MQPEAFCLHASFDPAGPSEFQMDRHYLLYALRGTMRLEADGRRWTLPPARGALIRADHPVTVTILSQLVSASVLFSPDFMEPPPVLTVFEMSPLARELVRECRDWGEGAGPLSPFATRIFGTLADVALRLAQAPSPCVLPSPTSDLLLRAVRLTEDRAHEDLTFEQVAQGTNQSPRALARRFASEMGMTWREVLRTIRIMKAVELLATTEAPITEIAFATGYGSISGFNTAFRQMMQASPNEYRRSFNP